MCSYIEYEGMGVRKITTFNQVLLDKWLWEKINSGGELLSQNTGGKLGRLAYGYSEKTSWI